MYPFSCVLRQIARYLPHHRSENASKTHPKSSHDKFKTASNWQDADIHFFRIARVHPVLFHGFSSKMALDSICNCL